MINKYSAIYKTYKKFERYKYIEYNSDYRIKNLHEFNHIYKGGICWDFMYPMSEHLNKYNIKNEYYFTCIIDIESNSIIITHTYIIALDHWWIECAWNKYKGIYNVLDYKCIENKLIKEYCNGNNCKCSIFTCIYNPKDVIGMSDIQFYKYLNEYAKIINRSLIV